jgi:mycobactin lysine-N-oxygenase
MTTLAVLGAGVKAVAVAAKAHVLSEMGVEAPNVVAIERTGVGANWQASGGWTDGAQRLGTSPEKDVGFPYRSSLVPRRNAELDERMTRHSWQAYLIATTNSRSGSTVAGRPRPTDSGVSTCAGSPTKSACRWCTARSTGSLSTASSGRCTPTKHACTPTV